MSYLMCFVLPPLALLGERRLFAACFSIMLLIGGIGLYPIAVLHALLYVWDARSRRKINQWERRANEREPRYYLRNRVDVYHRRDDEEPGEKYIY
ncbi:hypothetical protein D1872_81810 [compost metagenome]